jgi:hypothetical protein
MISPPLLVGGGIVVEIQQRGLTYYKLILLTLGYQQHIIINMNCWMSGVYPIILIKLYQVIDRQAQNIGELRSSQNAPYERNNSFIENPHASWRCGGIVMEIQYKHNFIITLNALGL